MNLTHMSAAETSGRADMTAEALIREAQARKRRRRRRNGAVLTVVVLALVAVLVDRQTSGSKAPSTSAPLPRTIGSSWRSAGLTAWQHGEPGNWLGAGPSSTISCAGAGQPTCYVIVQANGYQPDGRPTIVGVVPGDSPYRSSAYRSTDDGGAWERLTIPADTWLSSAFACSGPLTCAVGATIGAGQDPDSSGTQVVLTTDTGGHTWTRHALPASVGLVTQLACPSPSHCVALTWGRNDATVEGLQPYAGFDRFYPTGVIVTDDGGRRWTRSALPSMASDVADYLSSVSCPSVDECVFIGEQARITRYEGAYQTEDGPGLVLSSSDGGHLLTTSDELQGTPQAVACPTTSKCLAIVEDGGETVPSLLTGAGAGMWTVSSQNGLSTAFNGVISLSCPSPADCLATGSAGLATTADGGRRWTVTDSVPALPHGYRSDLVDQASCVASAHCLVLDDMFPAPTAFGPDATRVLTNSTSF